MNAESATTRLQRMAEDIAFVLSGAQWEYDDGSRQGLDRLWEAAVALAATDAPAGVTIRAWSEAGPVFVLEIITDGDHDRVQGRLDPFDVRLSRPFEELEPSGFADAAWLTETVATMVRAGLGTATDADEQALFRLGSPIRVIGRPVVAIDVDGVVRAAVESPHRLRHQLVASERLADYDNLTPQEQEEQRATVIESRRRDMLLLSAYGVRGGSPEQEAEAVERTLRTPSLPIPSGETIDSLVGRLGTATLTLDREGWPRTPFHRSWESLHGDAESADMDVVLVRWVGTWIRSLRERGVRVAWSATWGTAANTYLAPELGIEHMEAPTDDCQPRFSEDVFDWKRRALHQRYGDATPTVFLDDMGHESGASPEDLVVRTQPQFGLRPAEAAQVEDWLAGLVPGFEPRDAATIERGYR